MLLTYYAWWKTQNSIKTSTCAVAETSTALCKHQRYGQSKTATVCVHIGVDPWQDNINNYFFINT